MPCNYYKWGVVLVFCCRKSCRERIWSGTPLRRRSRRIKRRSSSTSSFPTWSATLLRFFSPSSFFLFFFFFSSLHFNLNFNSVHVIVFYFYLNPIVWLYETLIPCINPNFGFLASIAISGPSLSFESIRCIHPSFGFLELCPV